ncbi:MAG: phosphoribosylaminoimidazolesuccinocarboxamide synthase [Myxococcota bacterium]
MIDDQVLREQLGRILARTDLPLGEKHEGKVRDSYVKDGKRWLIASDRLSAFDVVLTTIPFKGQVLNQLAAYWFDATKAIAPNHVLGVPDPNVTLAVECRPLAIEMVVRAYLTGITSTSIWTAYARGERIFCGHRLPDGLRKHQRLDAPILTPSTKASIGAHDRSVSREEILAMGALTAEEFDTVAELSMRVFAHGAALARTRGLILVDTKYEFGRTPEGRIVFMDEVHTPDSSRYWYVDGYEQAFAKGEDPKALDKEYVRRHLVAKGYRGEGAPPPIETEVRLEAARRYIEAYERVTGRAFEPNTEEPIARIRRNLGL